VFALAACQAQPTVNPNTVNPNQNSPMLRSQTLDARALAETAPARTGFEQYSVIKTAQGKYWPKMELLRTPGLPAEPMQERGRQQDADVLSCFGSNLPPSTDVCLHDAGEPAQRISDVPVLLIHGANVNATTNWATPPYADNKPGLMQHLRNQGYRVFAVTFANKHGDNFVWVNQIHNAIDRVRKLTGAAQVDAIAHSKGGFALRMYVSDLQGPGMSHAYSKHIRKALFIGAPQRGLDYTFRHPIVQWAMLPEDNDPVKYAPQAWSKALIYGKWVDASRSNFMGPYFKGQAQMLSRWDATYGLDMSQPDWYTTYHGGQGFVSQSPGIDAVIKAGGNVVEQLRHAPVDPAIAVGILAGNSATFPGILNENAGPSDGLVLVKSSAAAEDLTAKGARLLDQTVLPLHHMALVADPKALNWVSQQLQK
jgi:hypothetical protein